MGIVRNIPCPACRENGHDSTGDHLIVFSDGGQLCTRAHFHTDGKRYYKKKGEKNPVFEHGIDGTIKYSVEEFEELEKSGKLKDPSVRALALSGMRERDRYEVMDDDEQRALEKQWEREVEHFNTLKIKCLVSRAITGPTAKLYNVRVGLNKKGKVVRHYYPVYDEDMNLTGAICRNLPKDFRTGKLGKTWGAKNKLFGQNTMKAVSKSGARKDVLTITGGQCDAMAAQDMLSESRKNTQYEGMLFHVWSVQKGEAGLEEILANLKDIKKFKQVKLCFDDDEVGRLLTQKVAQLLGPRALQIQMPDGMKDPNQCLIEDRAEEFVDAWWKAAEVERSSIKTADDADLWEKAITPVTMGISWPWPGVTEQTFGIRPNNMYTIGGGSGVGKTEVAKEVIQHIVDHHHEKVGVIFMEEPPEFTLKVLAGKWVNKKLHLPPNNHPKGHAKWDEGRDYTYEQMIQALKTLRAKKLVYIADCKGDTRISTIIARMEELKSYGCKYLFIDNLTTISHEGKEGSVKAIDESMKQFGTYMQTEPVSIFLLSHLSKPDESRKPFEDGGQVRQSDFRGSQSIAFWSTFMIGVERNTNGDREEKLITYLRCVKDRLTGQNTGEVVTLKGNPKTGRLLEPSAYSAPSPKDKKGKKGKKKKDKANKAKEY